jgi:hypothetical protein
MSAIATKALLPALLLSVSVVSACGGDGRDTDGAFLVFERSKPASSSRLIIERDGSAVIEHDSDVLDEQTASLQVGRRTRAKLRRALRDFPPSEEPEGEADGRTEYALSYRGTTVEWRDGAVPVGLEDAVRLVNRVLGRIGFA